MHVMVSILALLVVAPANAYANAGTPLIWASAFHLLIGNIFIGLVEGSIIARWFRIPWWRAVLIVVLANYISSFAGIFLFDNIIRMIAPSIYTVHVYLWGLVLLAFLVTIIVEWPCITCILRNQPRPWKNALKASLVVQCLSYLVIVPYYAAVSPVTIAKGNHIVHALDFVDRNVRVQFVADDNHYYTIRLDGSDQQPVAQANVQPLTQENAVTVTDYRPAPHSAWSIRPDRAWQQGLMLSNAKTDQHIHIGVSTPFFAWSARYPYFLPSDQVVFQFGDHQICVFDIPQRKLALLTFGREPLVIFPKEPQ